MKSPAFQFYPGDYLSSPDVTLMTLVEEGAYLRLLFFAWQQAKIGFLPNDDYTLRRYSKMSPEQWEESKTMLLGKFPATDDGKHRYNPRLQIEVEKQAKFREKSAVAGKKSAEKRWGKKEEFPSQPIENVTNLTPEITNLTKKVTLHIPITSESIEYKEGGENAAIAAHSELSEELRDAILACKSEKALTALWNAQPEPPIKGSPAQLTFTARKTELQAASHEKVKKMVATNRLDKSQPKPDAAALPLPYPSPKFLAVWHSLLTAPKQWVKPLTAHQATLRQLADLENEQVAVEAMERAISGNTQGVCYPETKERAMRLNHTGPPPPSVVPTKQYEHAYRLELTPEAKARQEQLARENEQRIIQENIDRIARNEAASHLRVA